ncbi:hypothetical protein H311_00378 [Anncaliia algerae PRA109]|nr:hypothetical protein H311_00378 [Anncaliia algerae PRA109]
MKEIYTRKREDFLVDFVWKFNNKIHMHQKNIRLRAMRL